MVNAESRSAPHSTCNWRRMTTMAWVKRFARRIKHKSVCLQTFRRCLPAQNQLADLSELPQHSATHHKHTHQVSIAQSMYPLEKSRFKWETTKVRLHLSAMLSLLDLAQTLCMENFNLKKAGGKLVTMMMMIMTSTKMMVVVILIIIMMVMVIMLKLIVLMMVAVVVGMLLLVGVMLQMAMVVIAMMTIGIFMMAMIIKRKKKYFLPQFVAYNTDCLLIETFKCCMYNLFPISLRLFREDIYEIYVHSHENANFYPYVNGGRGGGVGGLGGGLHIARIVKCKYNA